MERLRITPTPLHDDVLIDRLAIAPVDVWDRLGLARLDRVRAAEESGAGSSMLRRARARLSRGPQFAVNFLLQRNGDDRGWLRVIRHSAPVTGGNRREVCASTKTAPAGSRQKLIRELAMPIGFDDLVNDVMNDWPATIRVFFDFKMGCVGCPIACFHTVDDACREHHVDRDAFLKALRDVVA